MTEFVQLEEHLALDGEESAWRSYDARTQRDLFNQAVDLADERRELIATLEAENIELRRLAGLAGDPGSTIAP